GDRHALDVVEERIRLRLLGGRAEGRAVDDVGEEGLADEPYAVVLAGEDIDPGGVRRTARVREVEADRVADTGGEATLQHQQPPTRKPGHLDDTEPGVGPVPVLGREPEPRAGVLGAGATIAVPLPRLEAHDPGRVPRQGTLHRGEQGTPAGEEGEPLERLVGGGAARRGHLQRVRHGQAAQRTPFAVVPAYGRLGLRADQPGAVPVDDQSLGVERRAGLGGERDDPLRPEALRVEGEEGGAVGEGEKGVVPVHGERGEVADERALVRRLVEDVGLTCTPS
ncbi:hypothetical protein STRIP9103_03293, partial [Streptomyces ipomoeae 91-03]